MGSDDELTGPATIRPFVEFKKAVKVWVPDKLLRRSEISSGAKLVYARLARFEGKDGQARPKLDTLAKALGMSWSSVQRAVKELEDAQLIKVKVRRGHHRPNKFEFLDHPWLHEEEPEEPDDDPEGAPPPPTPEDSQGPTGGSLGSIQGPTGGSLGEAEEASDTHGRVSEIPQGPTGGSLEASDTHGRVSDEECHTTEESHTASEESHPSLRFAQSHARTHASTHARALRALEQPAERFALDEGAPPPLGQGSAGEEGVEQVEATSSAPYHQGELSMEDDEVNSYDIAQKLINGAVAEAKQKHSETKAKNEARRLKKAKSPEGNFNGNPKRNARVRPFEKLWREELLKKFPDLDEGSIGRWYAPYEKKGEDGQMYTGYRGLKEVGQVATLILKFDAKIVETYLVWGIQNWEKLRERFTKAPFHPTVGWLLSMSDSLVSEATSTVIGADVEAEVEQWFKDHPGKAELPAELLARLQALPGRGR